MLRFHSLFIVSRLLKEMHRIKRRLNVNYHDALVKSLGRLRTGKFLKVTTVYDSRQH